MSKLLIGAGIGVLSLGIGLFVAGQLDPMLHSAFKTGGIMWSVVGSITIGLGLKFGKKRKDEIEALK